MRQWLKAFTVASLVSMPAIAIAQAGGPSSGMMMDQDSIQEMQQNMELMHQTMQQMQGVSSPDERQRLRREHLEQMQEHFKIMRNSGMGPGMMGYGMGMHHNPGMGGQNSSKKQRPENAGQGMRQGDSALSSEQRLQQMEQRMDQMQWMMEQMLKNQRMGNQ